MTNVDVMRLVKKASVYMSRLGALPLLRRESQARRKFRDLREVFYEMYSVNICYNIFTPEHYDSGKRNVLLALESPEVVRTYWTWLTPDLQFDAEVSFGNYYGLEDYYCCRDLYATHDGFVQLLQPQPLVQKTKLVSMIYSNRTALRGHKMRHQIAERNKGVIDLYGSGLGKRLENKRESLDAYMFQIVVENGKHPEYVSEKLFDCLKTRTMPIYWGGEKGLREMGFDMRGIITFDSVEELEAIMATAVTERTYDDRREYIDRNYDQLVNIRRASRCQLYLGSIQHAYMHDPFSYSKGKISKTGAWMDRVPRS